MWEYFSFLICHLAFVWYISFVYIDIWKECEAKKQEDQGVDSHQRTI